MDWPACPFIPIFPSPANVSINHTPSAKYLQMVIDRPIPAQIDMISLTSCNVQDGTWLVNMVWEQLQLCEWSLEIFYPWTPAWHLLIRLITWRNWLLRKAAGIKSLLVEATRQLAWSLSMIHGSGWASVSSWRVMLVWHTALVMSLLPLLAHTSTSSSLIYYLYLNLAS